VDPSQLLSPRKQSSAEVAYTAIRKAILEGALRPGERIVEEGIAKSLRVSRTPVREALLKLERENLVDRGERGAVVRSFSANEIRDLMDLRCRIEAFAARLAAERAEPAEVAALAAIHEETLALLDAPGFSELDWLRDLTALNKRFHGAIALSAKHAPLERVSSFIQTPFAYQAHVWYDEPNRRRALEEHGRVIELIAAKDADGAEEAMAVHVRAGREFLMSRLPLSAG
jgi:DNA-binding GntR family transcriptional regulator